MSNPLDWLTMGNTVLTKVLDFIPDPADKAKAAQAYQMAMLDFAEKSQLSQAQVDDSEAKSADPFTSRARPFIIWVCGVSLAYTFLFAPLCNPLIMLHWPAYRPVTLDSATLMDLVTALLGVGGMHAFENVQASKAAASAKAAK